MSRLSLSEKADLDPHVWLDPSVQPVSRAKWIKLILTGRKALPPQLRLVVDHSILSGCGTALFVKNSKAGCTSLARFAYAYQSERDCPTSIHGEDKILRQGPRHAAAIHRVLDDPSVMRISLVRHPASRLVSAFRDFVLDARNYATVHHRPGLAAFGLDPRQSAERNFDVFLDYVGASLRLDPLATDRHLRRQSDNLCASAISYRLIGRIEAADRFEDDLRHLFGIARDDTRGCFPLSNESTQSYAINRAQLRKIEGLYAEDMERFGY